jgi:hypothetical protein
MLKRTSLGALALIALTTTPSLAAMCNDVGGYNFSFGIEFGKITESDRNEMALTRLRQMGVDATSVEQWGGCLRAFVRKPGGGEEMQYYDPNSYRRVQ